jgi:hypothetical protein
LRKPAAAAVEAVLSRAAAEAGPEAAAWVPWLVAILTRGERAEGAAARG